MRYRCLFLGIVIALSVQQLSAQYDDQPTYEDTVEVYSDVFYIEEPLNLTIKFNIKDFQKSRKEEKYHPAEMTCHVSDTFCVTHPVRVRARGKFRRDNCTMPTFWVNIRYAGIEAEELRNITKMKMVSRCKDAAQYKDYVLREYLVYKILNLLTDYSFRVRLVRVKFVDTGRKNKEYEDWGFFIEPEKMMVDRLGAVAIKSDKLSIRTVNEQMMDQAALFCYMIGQGDFSVTGRHNLKVLAVKEDGPRGFIPVPYDFDFCGLVNTEYAAPRESLGISSVRERYYLGPCQSQPKLQKAIADLSSSQDEITELIMNFEYLDQEAKEDMVTYLDSYFEEAADEQFIETRIAPTCR